MALSGSQRRDQRRRFVLSWKRSTSAAAPREAATLGTYAADAHPERHRGLAVLLPVGVGGFAGAILAILLPLSAAVGVVGYGLVAGSSLLPTGGRFSRTLAATAALLDPRSMLSLSGWIAQMCLVLAAAVSLSVRLMRRHRQDDYHGRYRAWGWMATLFLVTSCAGIAPVGPLVGAAIADASGIVLGPAGIGWWYVLAGTMLGLVSLWAVLPLHERLGTAAWLTLALVAWAGAAAAVWIDRGDARIALAGQVAWSLGAALAAIAMLAAARSVIREVRGLGGRPARSESPRKQVQQAPVANDDEDEETQVESRHFVPESDDDETSYVDGSEQEMRHLSRAERKRLKKLARQNRAVA